MARNHAGFAAGIFGVVGVLMLVFAAFIARSELAFRHEAVLVSGTVVDLESKGKGTWAPVVEYTDNAGAPHRVKGRSASKPPAYDKGETVQVRYRSEDPDSAHIDGFLESWGAATFMTAFGLAFAGAGAIILTRR
jgi:hypothetical protein